MEEEAELALGLIGVHLKTHPDNKPSKDCLFCMNFILPEGTSKSLSTPTFMVFDVSPYLNEQFLTERGWTDFHYYDNESFYCKRPISTTKLYNELIVNRGADVKVDVVRDYHDVYEEAFRDTIFKGMVTQEDFDILCKFLKIGNGKN
jgi:hypothetical protein